MWMWNSGIVEDDTAICNQNPVPQNPAIFVSARYSIYRVSDKKSYSSFWLVFKNACANLIQTYHGHSLKDGKNHSHKSKQLGRVTTSGMRLT